MADSVDVKPKILSLSEIEGMVAKQEQLKQATPEMMYKSGHPGSMTRPSKLFIKVDREGLLTDTIAISDVVDFDCYESIVSSACRIISCFQCCKPENIEVETLFYYKKRARSTRMNPVTIRSTTDAFKAVAEHPVGEVPIGVRWNQKFKYKFMTNTDSAKTLIPENGAQTSKEPHVRIAPKPSEDTENVVPEKKRKVQEETQKTLVVQQSHDAFKASLVGAADKSEPKAQNQHNATSHISPFNQAYPVISSEAFKGNKTNVHPTIPGKSLPAPYTTRSKEDDTDPPGEVEERSDRYMPRHTQDAQYMFPKGARSELVVTYGDGVVEKRKLPEEVLKVVNMMLKGNYSYLTKEAQTILSVGQNATPGEEKTDERDFYPTGRTRSGVIEFENSRPIKYIKDAKSEIFRILSMLSVSKTRFKSLLKWLKTLKLEDGKKGKFFLSARDIIGGTKYVISSGFEENEEQVLKHDQTYKPYGPLSHGIGPGGADMGSRPVPAIPEPPHNQIMFLMPTSIANLPSNATPVFKTSTGVTVVPTSKVVHVPGQPKSSQLILSSANSSSKTTETVSSVSSTPPILRKHPRKSSQPSRSRDVSPNPVPLNLYRAYQNSDVDRSSPVDRSVENDGCLTVKVEPHDYDSETSDTTVDYDRNSERDMISPRPGVHSDTFSGDHSTYTDSVSREYDKRKVLRSDAAMPLSTETERPFDIVIKSEPMDDFVCQ